MLERHRTEYQVFDAFRVLPPSASKLLPSTWQSRIKNPKRRTPPDFTYKVPAPICHSSALHNALLVSDGLPVPVSSRFEGRRIVPMHQRSWWSCFRISQSLEPKVRLIIETFMDRTNLRKSRLCDTGDQRANEKYGTSRNSTSPSSCL
jgi:hypothetical protein